MAFLNYIWLPVDFILNINEYLPAIMQNYGVLVYAILFLIIFAETGFVVTPFLPGDSLIFAAGALAVGSNGMNLPILLVIMPVAAIVGDACNYAIGKKLGGRLLERPDGRFIKKAHIEETQAFYAKHGGKTIILARFVPFVRTFAPFVAGVGHMEYKTFGFFNIIGGLIWTWGFLALGFFFGNIPFVEHNFEVVILGIIAISMLPGVYKFVESKLKK